jgi:glycosyltransferase involved in cell wall biosynthesis
MREEQAEKIKPSEIHNIRIIAPSLGNRYSGVNASVIAVLPEQARRAPIAMLGFHIPEGLPHISFWQLLRYCRKDRWRIWHARRNMEMLAGLILRHIFGFKFLLLFTSAAQRRHSMITRFYYHRMDRIITPTAAAASFLDRPAVVISHGVNTEIFSPPEDRAKIWAGLGLPGNFGIGIFGRIRPQKGTGEFIDAMIRVLPERPDWTAVIIGQTTREFRGYEQGLRARVRAAGLESRVQFAGFQADPAAIPDWYRALSVVVCPSRNEGFGLPCLEAMASGCPVVATMTGAWPELITEGEDGYLVPCEDAAALADAIMKITADPEAVSQMGRSAREKVLRQYSIKNEAEGIHAVYRQLFAERSIPFDEE